MFSPEHYGTEKKYCTHLLRKECYCAKLDQDLTVQDVLFSCLKNGLCPYWYCKPKDRKAAEEVAMRFTGLGKLFPQEALLTLFLPPISRVRGLRLSEIQKLSIIFSIRNGLPLWRVNNVQSGYRFEDYKYGPYSFQLQLELDKLVDERALAVQSNMVSISNVLPSKLERILEKTNRKELQVLDKLMKRYISMGTGKLIALATRIFALNEPKIAPLLFSLYKYRKQINKTTINRNATHPSTTTPEEMLYRNLARFMEVGPRDGTN